MLEETIKLEMFRQKIEKAEYEAGDTSDFIDRGRPNDKQLKDAQNFIALKNREVEALKLEFHQLIAQTSSQTLEEWVGWHRNILQKILAEQATDTKGRTRLFTARQTLEAWEKVSRREQEYISINWYYLKDYKEETIREFSKGWWKFWK